MSRSKKKKRANNPRTFLDDAEKIIRKYAKQNEELVVYRGMVSNRSGYEEEMIIVELSDNKKVDRPPDLEVMKISLGKMAFISFDNNYMCWCPFGGGWYPLQEVERLTKLLPNII